jgi:5-methyltetrahydropteroyltriglutamate--homocysteine methyltransferase
MRELKTALESFWSGKSSEEQLEAVGRQLRSKAWKLQHEAGIDLVPSNDFSFYDHVLDTVAMVGAVPDRFLWHGERVDLQTYFLMARGALKIGSLNGRSVEAPPMEMTKWFNTNYHFIVPEVSDDQIFKPAGDKCVDEFQEAKDQGLITRPVLLGPVSFLRLAKGYSMAQVPRLISGLVEVYAHYLQRLYEAGCTWAQLDEPCLSVDLEPEWHEAFELAYNKLADRKVSVLLASYFSSLNENWKLALSLPVEGVHIDLINAGHELETVIDRWPSSRYLSAGVVDGHNVWRTDLTKTIERLENIAEKVGPERLIVAPSCSLLHVPIDVELETGIDEEIRSWLAFADQKIEEIATLTDALCVGQAEIQAALRGNRAIIARQKTSEIRHNRVVEERLQTIQPQMLERKNSFRRRRIMQQDKLKLPLLPTTTIGSFPQTKQIREARKQLRRGELSQIAYERAMQTEIKNNIQLQEKIGLDVLVHGEPERTDMVEYFANLLDGITATQHGWVQSYGSRCVKPPIVFGAVSRPGPMTVQWAQYAQSLTARPVKGMLTGPVTILQWSFVRDDQPRKKTCMELALAIRDEVRDLELAGISVIQIDEPAIREGLPLKRRDWSEYLAWSVDCFRLATSDVADETQIHTHMCYSEFSDMVDSIARMDADVISIEAARSQMDLLETLKETGYPNAIGPGVYDIHSPRVPEPEEIERLLGKALDVLPADRLWVNPDCGLKTRNWEEVIPALNALVQTAIRLRMRPILLSRH